MQHPLRNKSLLLFTLIFCSFFSCQQIIDIIKPQPPKPIQQSCRLLKVSQAPGTLGSARTYVYDSKGRVSKIIYDPNQSDDNPERFVSDTLIYNASNQIIRQSRSMSRGGFVKVFEYDSQGRIIKDVTDTKVVVEQTITSEYSYVGDTIKVKSTTATPFETTAMEYSYVFENENLVKTLVAPNVVVATYEYSTNLNKLSPLEKQLAYITSFTGDSRTRLLPSISKNLVSREENPLNGLVTSYTWEFNEQGYPIMRTQVNRFGIFTEFYTYDCNQK